MAIEEKFWDNAILRVYHLQMKSEEADLSVAQNTRLHIAM